MSLILLGVLGYIAVQLLIGWLVSRGIRTEDDYLLAGRRMGYALATGTIFATWFGAETCVGAAGEVFDGGIALTSAEPFGYGVCLVLMGMVFARPLWKRKLVTLADLFRERFSGGVERLAAVLLIPTSVLWAAAQVRAFGQVLASASELNVTAAIVLAAAIAIVYTTFGGLLADAITDLIQGGALVVGLVVLLVAVVIELGGPSGAIEAIDSSRVHLAATADVPWLATVEAWTIPILGSVVAQELVARISAARSPEVARRSSIAAGGIYLAVGLIPVYLGLVAPGILGPLEHGEQALPMLAQRHLSTLLYVVFAGALVSAILSTVDSTLLVASSLLSHNVIQPLRPAMNERAKVRTARAGVIAFGILACGLALGAEGVYALVEQASAFGSAGVIVTVVFGLFTRVGGRASAYAALLAGAVVYVASGPAGCPYPYLASLAAALVGYLGSAFIGPPRAPRAARPAPPA
jgi:Na+/proline symporter